MGSGRIPLETVLAACETTGAGHEPVTASEIAEELGCTRRTAYNKLVELADRGDVHSKKVGARSRVWWRPASPDSQADGAATQALDSADDMGDSTSVALEDRTEHEDSERQLSVLLDNVPGMIYRCRNERGWPMEFVSDGCRDLTGYESDALERGDVSYGDDLVVEADRDELWTDVQSAVTDREQFLVTYRIETASGDVRWVRERGRGVFDEEGMVEALEGVIIDVTDHKRLETELEEFFGRISDAFYALDKEYRFTHVNERAEELLQHSEEELLGENLWETFPEAAEEDDVWEAFHTAMETQEPTSYELYYEPLDFWVEANVYPSETGVSVYFRDVTERVKREQALRESERRYRTLAEHFPNGVVTLFDEDLRYTLAAGQAFENLPVTADDLEGNRPREVFGDEVGDVLESASRSALDGDTTSVDTQYAGREWTVYAVPITDDKGEAFTGLAMAQDVTERKEHERQLEETVKQLEESNERLERFASMLAHELRNPVTIGQIYSGQLPAEPDSEAVTYVSEAFDRIEDMIDVMLVLTRGRDAVDESSSVNVATVARKAWDTVDTHDGTLEVTADQTIRADETYIRHLFRNLFENAIEHGGRDVTITVGELSTGFYVADDGEGIPAGERKAVFEPGFTTTAEEGGTGLGLAFVHKLAEVYEWECVVTEGKAGGARFEFTNVT